MHTNAVHQTLASLGLTEREITLYLTSLRIGPTAVLTLAHEAKIHRTITYKLLERLIAEGLFRTTFSGKRKVYYAIAPKELLTVLKSRERALTDIIPTLEFQTKRLNFKPKITYFEGQDQLQELFRTGLTASDKQILAYFPSKYMAELFGKTDMEKIIQERIRLGIHSKTLRAYDTEIEFATAESSDALREVRYVPDGHEPEMAFVVFDNKVNLFAPITENYGMQIESESHSHLMRYLFNQLWKLSSEK